MMMQYSYRVLLVSLSEKFNTEIGSLLQDSFDAGAVDCVSCAGEAREGGFGMSIGEKIAAARKAKGWSQEALGEEIGVSVQAVSKWENNLSRPDTDWNQGIRFSARTGCTLM